LFVIHVPIKFVRYDTITDYAEKSERKLCRLRKSTCARYTISFYYLVRDSVTNKEFFSLEKFCRKLKSL